MSPKFPNSGLPPLPPSLIATPWPRSNLLMSSVTDKSSSPAGDSRASSVGVSPPQIVDTPPPADVLMVAPYSSIAVQSHVPMQLDLRASNYTKRKFGLLAHIDGTPTPNPLTDNWLRSQLVLWLRRQLWVAIQQRFEVNKAPRGDLSIEDYGKAMKKAADSDTRNNISKTSNL
nr:unnamed protein product [Digitaria exilis]